MPAVGGQVVDAILALPESDILACRTVIASLPRVGLLLEPEEAERLLEFFSATLLTQYRFERSEVAIGTILDVMSPLTKVWTDKNHQGLYNLGLDMYDWFSEATLRVGVLSSAVLSRVARFLIDLCHVDTEYGEEGQSVRSTLFGLLKSNITVLYYLSGRISAIFGLFVLSEHEGMFDDLAGNLPADSDSIEGMAMRLLFLSKLAGAWHSLLRQCVYRLFETAAIVNTSTKHAAHCISDLASTLSFSSPQKLFRLFAPQILHTYLEIKPLASLPFGAFRYASIEELLRSNQVEITAQLLMRNNEKGMQYLETILKASRSDLVRHAFAKCVAYTICWDLGHELAPKAESKAAGKAESETRVRKLIGTKEDMNQMIMLHFPTIMGYFYITINPVDDPNNDWLSESPTYEKVREALAECKFYSNTARALPPSLQPSFKSRFLIKQIERLCRRTGYDPVKPWNPSSFSLAVRMLLDSIDNALGPLYMCLVLQKLRLLVCMAGSVALSGFPLEMLLHSLRPFLSDPQCADDAIGMLQYLLLKGQQYLAIESLPFTDGVIMLMILQMHEHSGVRQDSTMQESHVNATIESMHKFNARLVRYLQNCHASGKQSFYASFTDALDRCRLPGNACKGSGESRLLLILLDQLCKSKPLISRADCNEALSLLSKNFEAPSSFGDDCLGDDHESVRYADVIWQVLRTSSLDDGFRLWVAGVLGRAYASTGVRPSPSLHEHTRLVHTSGAYQGSKRSQAIIARRLAEMVMSRNRAEAGLADHTLRQIRFMFPEEEDAVVFEQMLPKALVSAVNDGTFGYIPNTAVECGATAVIREQLQNTLQVSFLATDEEWMKNLAVTICRWGSSTPVIPALPALLQNFPMLAPELLPAIIHLTLLQEKNGNQVLKEELARSMAAHLAEKTPSLCQRQRFMLQLVLYLRDQPWPGEATQNDRLDKWLEVDYILAAEAAARCKMPTAALLMAELASPNISDQSSSRRKSRTSIGVSETLPAEIPNELLLDIFKQVEEPDSFYGVQQPASLGSVLDRLDYERDGMKSLMFRSAQMDSAMRMTHHPATPGSVGIAHSLSALSLNSLTYSVLSGNLGDGTQTADEMFDTARKLQQWDLATPESLSGPAATSFAIFQQLSRSTDILEMKTKLSSVLAEHVQLEVRKWQVDKPSHSWFGTLATLTEIAEVLDVSGDTSFASQWESMISRQGWMQVAPFQDCQAIMSNRHTLFSVVSQNKNLLNAMHVGVKKCKITEAQSLIAISQFARNHGVLQEALSASTQVSLLAANTADLGVQVDAAAKLETASILWDMGENTTSVKMLREIVNGVDSEMQDISVGHSGLLAQIGHQLAEARLEMPDDIQHKYLEPAIEHLKGRNTGPEAGRVYFEFASFCDKQLQNPGNIEDFNRMAKLRQRRQSELDAMKELLNGKHGQEKKVYQHQESKARTWYKIDDAEYQRLKNSREKSIQMSLKNYLLALQACDTHDICVLRFFALWLDNSASAIANDVVSKFLKGVPSRKFVRLLNQLTSRLEHSASSFQESLKHLLETICREHPYHILHHLYAATRRPKDSSSAAMPRYEAAMRIRKKLYSSGGPYQDLLMRFFSANSHYNVLAGAQTPPVKGNKLSLASFDSAQSTAHQIVAMKVPPATIDLPLRADCDYSNTPIVTHFGPNIQIMGGISAPKVLTLLTSNGEQYKQLFKGGNDDLRQDAIMEQVFEEVSKMLRKHKPTRQRSLHVRTYKVVPLTTTSGIIEFVANSIPIGEFLRPAHPRYYPKDVRESQAREKIVQASKDSVTQRVKAFQSVCEHLHPVLRYFFLERFADPDIWFEKRTAYTRTTASVSILGHVLGLGDRHCHNILLDEKSGEAIHIDLGVAFEAGRVLPVPELVPFRLTRDIVDGMGTTKTEGVFRRCCELTMDALREDKGSLMTLLNVLRYDPLVNWTLSPVQAKRMQEETERNAREGDEASSKKEEEVGEADRALEIVEKKLSKTLSTAATVNELIQQATDVKHLATLYHGWAAYY